MHLRPALHTRWLVWARRHDTAGRTQRTLEWCVLLLAGTALSWLSTGFVFGTNNNVYHLPIVGALFDLPQFEGDAFVQSLRGFSSGLWMLLEGSDRVVDPATLFLAMHLLGKALSLWAMVLIAQELGLAGLAQRAGFMALVALMPVLQGHAFAGHGGLFMNYTTHSELANGVALLMLWACLRQRFGLALGLIGGVFFLNAFMAVWSVAPWAWLLLRAGRADRSLWARQRAALVAGAAAAAVLAAPVLWRALRSGLVGHAADASFDYRAYLLDYYPYHFLAAAMPPGQWVGLAAVVAAAVLGLRALGGRGVALGQALVAFGLVYGIGMLLPALTGSRSLLNLHLLRVSVFAHLIAGIVIGVAIVQGFASADPRRRWIIAPWLAVCALAPRGAIIGTLAWPLLQRLGDRFGDRAVASAKPVGVTLLVLAVASAAFTTQRTLRTHTSLQRSVADWTALAEAIERSTAPDAVVLLPLDTDLWTPADAGAGVFEYRAHRRVWADRKRGAAVMWAPAYHAEWSGRTAALATLSGWDARLHFARANGIDLVVDRCVGLADTTAGNRVIRAGRLCAVRVPGPGP